MLKKILVWSLMFLFGTGIFVSQVTHVSAKGLSLIPGASADLINLYETDGGGGTLEDSFKAATNTDTKLYSYMSESMGNNYTDEGDLSDNGIVSVIPKKVFYTPGTYTYVGNEWGFYAKTTSENAWVYQCEVVIFDITVTLPGEFYGDSEAQVKVKPVIQCVYHCTNNLNNLPGFDSSLDYVVSINPYNYFINNIYLANIVICSSVTEANSADSYLNTDYVETMTIESISQEPNYAADSPLNKEMVFKIAMFVGSKLPLVGSYFSLISRSKTGMEILNGLLFCDKIIQGDIVDQTDKSIKIDISESYTTHIKYFEGWLQSVALGAYEGTENIEVGDNADYNYLYNSLNGCFMKTTVEYTCDFPVDASGYKIELSSEMNFSTCISLDIVTQDESTFELTKVAEVCGEADYGKYQRYGELMNMYEPTAVVINDPGTADYFKIAADYNGIYQIKKTGCSTNTRIEIYDNVGNLVVSSTAVDFTFRVNSDIEYYVKTKYLSDDYTGTYNILVMPQYMGLLSTDYYKYIYFTEPKAVTYYFCPTKSADYYIYTGGTQDTLIKLYDKYGNFITANDDNINDDNAKILVHLVAGETYYVQLVNKSTTWGYAKVYVLECVYIDPDPFYIPKDGIELM
ncbi:MAG TPA: hypothetical protein PLH02_05310 [Bacillota bacterium]|nr:hypothetical protein [Bacillota bacterium]HPF42634.1 hypothetical protein [Bacillota bacterium]HPJ86201.1 hypothetical protein [Bacillota bacterium]HPQ62265.1 hypothetical protein [Bacillota bacterium]